MAQEHKGGLFFFLVQTRLEVVMSTKIPFHAFLLEIDNLDMMWTFRALSTATRSDLSSDNDNKKAAT